MPNRKLSGICVLVVDDADDNLAWMRLVLELEGATVFTTPFASEAFDVLDRERVDVLMTELALPHLDGYELLRTIRDWRSNENTDVPAVAMSERTIDVDLARALEAGFAAYIVKPVLAETIVAAVADIVSR